jgi:hypothetical protein
MKRLVIAIVLVVASAFCANAQEPAPAATRGKLSTTFHFIGRHVKESFTDCKTDKLWCFYVVGSSLIDAADTGTTIVAMHRGGFGETSPFFGSHPSTFRLVSESAAITVTRLTVFHIARERYSNLCNREADDPNSMYSRIAAKRGISPDPHRCTLAMDLVGWTPVPYQVAAVVSNIKLLKAN